MITVSKSPSAGLDNAYLVYSGVQINSKRLKGIFVSWLDSVHGAESLRGVEEMIVCIRRK